MTTEQEVVQEVVEAVAQESPSAAGLMAVLDPQTGKLKWK